MSKKYRPQTELVRGGLYRTENMETSEALFLNSGYVYDKAIDAEDAFNGERPRYVYSRFQNPTIEMLTEKLCIMEGAAAGVCVATGMAAVFNTFAALLEQGDRVVSSRTLFGSNYLILDLFLRKWGIETDFVDGYDLSQWEEQLSKPAKMVFLESPSNPSIEVIDVPEVVKLAKKAGALSVVDNVFATPILQKPMEMGADIVIYSTTKHMDGQGRCLGGAILANDEELITEIIHPFIRNTGPNMSPFNAWVTLKGLETLELRMMRHCSNAQTLAEWLSKHPKVDTVRYPGLPTDPYHEVAKKQMTGGFGGVMAIEVQGDKDNTFRLMDNLQLVDISNNLGDTRSLIAHPATTTHQRMTDEEKQAMNIPPNLSRLSVGLEDIDDLIEDFEQALQHVQ